jgi:hypothetical protein
MRRLLTVTGITVASAGLLAASVSASTPPLPNGSFYGQLSGSEHTPIGTCPVTPPSGATDSICAQLKGPFTVTAKGGKKLTGTYVGTLATGPADSSGLGDCNTTNETFTFTVGSGNTFKAVQSTSGDPNRVCVIDLETAPAPNPTLIVTTIFSMKITSGTGRFKGLVGTIVEDGSILPNLGPTGLVQPTGRTSANVQMFFGAN